MKLPDLPSPGQSLRCSQCGMSCVGAQVILQGEALEPICAGCLQRLDPDRAEVLSKIQRLGLPPADSDDR